METLSFAARTYCSNRTKLDSELFEEPLWIKLEVGVADSNDVEALLQHLYHDKPLHTASPFDQTARILRASTQFDFPELRKLALERLQALYPRRPAPFECTHWQHVADASQLALDCDARELLPALFYAMVTTMDFDIDESSYDQHSSPVGIPSDKANATPTPRHDLHRLCAQLMKAIMDHFAPVLFTVPTSSHMKCTGVFADHWMTLAIQPALDDCGVFKPLETLKEIQEVDWKSLGLCDACCAEKQKEWEDQADDIWFRMDGWICLDTCSTSSRSSQH